MFSYHFLAFYTFFTTMEKTHPDQGADFKIDKFVKMSAVLQGMGFSFLEVNGDVYVV